MRRRNQQSFIIHNFYCLNCLNMLPLPRTEGKLRERGHLKKIYCPRCKEEVNHAEINPESSKYTFEDFLNEWELGRFTDDGQRVPGSKLSHCSVGECIYNRDGLCWNANNSYKCKHRK